MGPDLPGGADAAAVDAAVAELQAMFLADQSMGSVLQRVVELAAAVLPGAVEASITVLQSGNERATVASSGLLAYELDETQYRTRGGPCVAAATTDVVVLLDDTATDTRWPAFTRLARQRGAGSVLSVPVQLPASRDDRRQNRRRVRAALNLYATAAGVFGAAAQRAAERYAAGAATTVANMRALTASRELVEGLREAADARMVIEQAKGILMARRGHTADEAFQVLSTASQRSHRKLRDVAADVVADGDLPS